MRIIFWPSSSERSVNIVLIAELFFPMANHHTVPNAKLHIIVVAIVKSLIGRLGTRKIA